MSCAKIDDGFFDNPKVDGLSWGARGVWATGLSWCARKLSDGRISCRAAILHGFPEPLIAELVAAKLWDPAPDGNGWVVHNYLRYNPSKAEVQALRESAKQRRRKTSKGGRVSDASRESAYPAELAAEGDVAVVFQLYPTRWSQQIGREWFAELFARLCGKDTSRLDYSKPDKIWNPQLGRLGAKSEKDRATVAKHALATPYLLERPSQLNPDHLLKFWDDFLAGPRTVMKQPVSTRGFNPAMKPSSLDDDSGRAPEWVGKP